MAKLAILADLSSSESLSEQSIDILDFKISNESKIKKNQSFSSCFFFWSINAKGTTDKEYETQNDDRQRTLSIIPSILLCALR